MVLKTILLGILGKSSGEGSLAVAVGVSDMWQVSGDRWHIFHIFLCFLSVPTHALRNSMSPVCRIENKCIWLNLANKINPKISKQTVKVTKYSDLYTIHFTLYNVNYSLYTMYNTLLYTMYNTLYTIRSNLYTS